MYHFTLAGSIINISDNEASTRMINISSQWEDEITKLGTLYTGVYDWAYTNDKGKIQLHIPKLRTGGEIMKNEKASSLFGFDIFGECFLYENNIGAKQIIELKAKK